MTGVLVLGERLGGRVWKRDEMRAADGANKEEKVKK
jgi:hypothetical protein